MKKTVLVWGLLSGLIAVCIQWIVYSLCYNDYMSPDNSTVGYAGMLITFSMVFFGIKSYRDDHNGGTITFWQGVKIGLMITVIASVIHAIGWFVYDFINPDFKNFFLQKFTELKNAELTDPTDKVALQAVSQEVEMLRTIYNNPLLNFVVMAIFLMPAGIIVTFVSSALLRKGSLMPASNEENMNLEEN